MSRFGEYIKHATSIADLVGGEKAHSSITDWVEVLSSDRYTEDSLDGITELVESIRLQGMEGITESSRALRKKLKYGNVHRQIRALTILRALSENGSKNYQAYFANAQLVERLKEMATDTLTDPKVKRKLISVFHAWSLQYADDPKNSTIAHMYAQYSGKKTIAPAPRSSATTSSSASRGGSGYPAPTATKPPKPAFEDLEHSWAPKGGRSTGDPTYADLAAAKEQAEARKRDREAAAAIEAREAEVARRERLIRSQEDEKKQSAEYQKKKAEEELKKRQEKERLRLAAEKAKNTPKRPPFDFAKERPMILVSIANASQSANNLVNACRHVNREMENLVTNAKVQEYLEKAKAARRPIIRYIQLVTDEEFVGTLLEANEKIVEAIQLYDKLSKPAALDSDSEHEDASAAKRGGREPSEREMETMRRRMEAQKLESQRTGELSRLQEKQKRESERAMERRAAGGRPSRYYEERPAASKPANRIIDYDEESERGHNSLSDFSDYDSSADEGYRPSQPASRRQSKSAAYIEQPSYRYLDEDEEDVPRQSAKLDPYDPFSDPGDYLGSVGGGGARSSSGKPKARQEWAAI